MSIEQPPKPNKGDYLYHVGLTYMSTIHVDTYRVLFTYEDASIPLVNNWRPWNCQTIYKPFMQMNNQKKCFKSDEFEWKFFYDLNSAFGAYRIYLGHQLDTYHAHVASLEKQIEELYEYLSDVKGLQLDHEAVQSYVRRHMLINGEITEVISPEGVLRSD